MKIFVVVFIYLLSLSVYAETIQTLTDYLREQLKGQESTSKETFKLSPEQIDKLKEIALKATDEQFIFFYGKSKDGKIKKACTVVSQEGKEGPMSIGVCFDPDGIVTSVDLLSMLEDHGQKVKEQSFLKQFKGKNVASSFQVGKDINGVSGATISSWAVSEAVRKSSYAFKTFIQKK
jgi:Na+-translocating ferredoxin:NAD+ oxidoreductase RnfG subunit